VVEDLSGLEPAGSDWFDPDELPGTLGNLLTEIGRTHVPALLANAAAIERGEQEVRAEIDGRPWIQQPFPYQAKCLQWLRQAYVQLQGEDRTRLDRILDGTGCEALFVKP